MKAPFVEDFDNRRRQVRHYVLSVASAERAAQIGMSSRAREGRLMTLRAGTFLVLYNLVEASTRATVEAIHDRIVTEQVPFDWLADALKREVVRRFINRADPAVHHAMNDLPAQFVSVALDLSVHLAGNVDARVIRDFGGIYGFSCETNRARTHNGADLLTIKDNRNDLAHGRKTFEEVGRDYPAGELLPLARRSLSFVEGVLCNVSDYLDAKGYLRADAR